MTSLHVISRRHFLQTSIAAISLAGASAKGFETKPAGFIDSHVHVWTPDTRRYPLADTFSIKDMVPPSFTPDELLKECSPCGVDRIVLVQMNFYGNDNSYMTDVIEASPNQFRGIAQIDETQTDLKTELKRLHAAGIRGVRLWADKASVQKWQTSEAIQSLWKLGADLNINMCLLANPDALPGIQKLCQKFSKTPVVIDHFARIGMKGEVDSAELDLLCRLSENSSVTVKTSAFYALGKKAAPYTDLGPMIKTLRDAYGANRLMWGSDCPYQVMEGHTYADSIALIQKNLSFLSEDEKRAILQGTAESVFFN
ncbi:amidohydrolase family protein [Planctomicrobium sp. SH668]|uniref:amidohydrolase family protein n=1 Tax=Planctomicrobium sp. SH668 TaxID=3448126 RepID=UPI003F5B5BDC